MAAVRSSPASRLTRERIVAAVARLLEDAGVDAVSTRTIGEALGVHPTALYRHFRDIDELLREAADKILAGVAESVPGPGSGDSLEAAAELSRRVRAVLLAHPGAARIAASGPSRMAHERAITEKLLGLLAVTGLPEPEVALAYHALIEFTVGSAAIDSIDPALTGAQVDERHRSWRAAYMAASPQDFPHSVRFAASLYPSLDEQYEYGLAVMIAGLRERIGASTGRPPVS